MAEVVETIEREITNDKGEKIKQKVMVTKLQIYKLKPCKFEKFNLEEENKEFRPLENDPIKPVWNKKKNKRITIKADEDIYDLTSQKKRTTEMIKAYQKFLDGKGEFPTESEPYKPKYQYRREGQAIKVSNIGDEFDDSDLIKLFTPFGEVRNVFFPIPRYADKQKEKKKHYGFGIVSFYDKNAVDKIMAIKDDFIMGNIVLSLTKK